MELIKPDLGLLFWMLVSFSVVLYLLKKFAWKPILTMLKNREESIDKALSEARIAREEIEGLKADNDRIIKEAKVERDNIIRQAKESGDEIIKQAKNDAELERKRIMAETRELVLKEKETAFKELKGEISDMVISVTTKILNHELKKPEEIKVQIDQSLKEL